MGAILKKYSFKLLNKMGYLFFPGKGFKLKFEYLYWVYKLFREVNYRNAHYEYFFTDFFDIDRDDYRDKIILDIGCGPRGSLEWAIDAKERIGLDPLAKKYLKLGASGHNMSYIQGIAENIPFQDESFDVISSFNSFDHFDHIEKAVNEINRVLKKGGIFLLICDIHDYSKLCEPQAISWDIVILLKRHFKIVTTRKYRGTRMYKSLRKGELIEDIRVGSEGIIAVKMTKE